MTRSSADPVDRLGHDPESGDDIANLYPQAPNLIVREILERHEFRYAGIEVLISGDVPMMRPTMRFWAARSAWRQSSRYWW